MTRALLIITALFLFALCNDSSDEPTQTGPCGEPTIRSCTGDPCAYMHIFNSANQLVREGAATLVGGPAQIYWDGKDCGGAFVPCGEYRMEIYVVQGGQTVHSTQMTLVSDSLSDPETGAACDSLRQACAGTGSYYEQTSSTYGRACLCCR